MIKQIANDGHEIGCHYYFHDFMKSESIYNIEKNLIKAKTLLEEASGKKVIGFRAPYFAIEKRNPSQYKIVEKLFEYDSSFSCTSKKELESFKHNMGLKTLKLLPIFQKKFGIINLKLGGSFLKFPEIYMNWMINQSSKEGLTPHLYMHPYEFGNSENLRLTKKDLESLGFRKSIYWQLRQFQWLKIRNNTLYEQVKKLINNNQLEGILANKLLDESQKK